MDEILEVLKRLHKYAELVEKDICDQDTGWYYQFGAAIEKAGNLLYRLEWKDNG
jgi:hypothetical protein